MDIYEAVAKRRTIRDLQQKPIEREILYRIIDAGLKAPSNDHMRNWEFVLIEDEQIKERIAGEVVKTAPSDTKAINDMLNDWNLQDKNQRDMYLSAVPKQYLMLKNSGALLLVFFKGDVTNPKTLSSLNCFASIWMCIENMLLAAASEGIFGVTRIPLGNEAETVRCAVGYPDGYTFACYLSLGYPAENTSEIEQYSFNAAEKLHINKW